MDIYILNKQLSDEEMALKQKLELYVNQVQEPEDPALQKQALEGLKQEIRAAITSPNGDVSKTLKFLQPHYRTLKAYYQENMQDDDSNSLKELLADVLSVLATRSLDTGYGKQRECLKYRLLGTKDDDFTKWGDEYMKKLAAEVKEEYAQQTEIPAGADGDFLVLVKQMLMFYRKNNSVSEAINLIIDFKDPTRNQLLDKFIDQENYKEACSYLKNLAICLPSEQQKTILENAYEFYSRNEDYVRAFQVMLFLEDKHQIVKVLYNSTDPLQKKQFCYVIARHGVSLKLKDDEVQGMVFGDDEKEMQKIINNLMLSQGYLILSHKVMEPKSVKDICKVGSGGSATAASEGVDSGRQILAETFVNAFLNAGFGKDNLIMGEDEWVEKNKGHGNISAIASLGLICLWDLDNEAKLEKYIDYEDSHVLAGALLGLGILNSSVRQDPNHALDLLKDNADNQDPSIRIGAVMGLGIAYANTQNKRIGEKLKFLLNHETSLDVVAFSAIALGLVYIGSHNFFAETAITDAIGRLSTGDHKQKEELPLWRLLFLGYCLMYLRTTKSVESAATNLNVMQENQVHLSVLSCAYAGTRDKVTRNTLYDDCNKEVAVLGIAMIAMGDEKGLDTTIEYLMNLLKNGNQNIKKTVPLALSLLCISNPIRANVIETLHTLSHDTNSEVVMSAIISLGLVGSGTKNAEIAVMLRDLSNYYSNNDVLFCVQIAQGLVHLGKGLLTLNPYHSEGFLVSPVAIGGLVTFLYSCLDLNEMILGKYHYVLYFLVLAMQPKMLITVDENLKPLPVPVQVGQDVDIVSNAGQIFETPVVLSPGEKAILSTNKYVPLSPILEGFVILKNNPEYNEATEE